jgi:zinc protease
MLRPLSVLFSFLLIAACAPPPVVVAPVEAPDAPPVIVDARLAEPLALDPAVRTGTLLNGLTYYVRRNAEPRQRAELRLVVNAGSILEEEDQRGLAHLLEHMAFNGTERFPERALTAFLESIGMRFGPDVNAYTSFDETVYELQLPTDDAVALQTGFEVLHEWANAITLAEADIDAERGVVLEEWRGGRGAQARLRDQTFPVIFGGSRYAERLPIGLPEVILNAPPERLRTFYRDWYRPDLMAVVAVGDFDPDEIEATIRGLFVDLTTPPDAPERPTFEVPDHAETRFAIATDPEQPITSVTLLYKADAARTETVGDFREDLVDGLYVQMINARLREITRQPGAPFLGGSAFHSRFVRPTDVFGMGAAVQEGGVPRAVDALLTEAARVRLHGFTEGELERARADMLRGFRRAFEERETTLSRVYAERYVSHFLEGQAVPSAELRYRLAGELIAEISLAEIDARAEAVTGEENRVILVSAPERADLSPPTEAELREVLARVEAKEIEPYVDAGVAEALIPEPPAPSAIVGESRYDDGTEVIEWSLANGATVVLRPTDFRADEVLFTAFGSGGTSLVEDARARDAEQAAAAVQVGGLGTFSATDLERQLAGTAAQVAPYITMQESGLRGSASPQDLQTLFELIHLHFTAPRADPPAFEAYRERTTTVLRNRSAVPAMVFVDTLIATLSQGHPRALPMTAEDIEAVRLDEALAIYRERFSNASDFTFVFVGAFDPDELAPFVERYIATLPGDPARTERARDLGIRMPQGVVERTVYRGIEPQARVQMVFHGDLRYIPPAHDAAAHEADRAAQQAQARRERFLLAALSEALNIRLRDELREERGGVYGVSVGASPDRLRGLYSMNIGFVTDPERVEELTAAVIEEIERFRTGGPDAEIVARLAEIGRRGQETSLRTNSYWLSSLAEAYRHGESPTDYLFRDDLRDQLTSAMLREAARRYLDPNRVVRVILLPEGR